MKRAVAYLPQDILEGLRKMAAGKNRSVASLIREAVDRVYGEDIEDVRIGEARLARYLADPKTAVPLENIIAEEERLNAKAV